MKKIFFYTLLLVCSLCVNAQELKFMGIPVTGSVDILHEKLCKEKHFHPSVEGDWFNRYTGYFFGRDVTVQIAFVPSTRDVEHIEVTFPERDTHAIKMYNTLVKQLDKKYGECTVADANSSYWPVGKDYSIHLKIKDSNIVTLTYNNRPNSSKGMKETMTTDHVTKSFAKYCEDL